MLLVGLELGRLAGDGPLAALGCHWLVEHHDIAHGAAVEDQVVHPVRGHVQARPLRDVVAPVQRPVDLPLAVRAGGGQGPGIAQAHHPGRLTKAATAPLQRADDRRVEAHAYHPGQLGR